MSAAITASPLGTSGTRYQDPDMVVINLKKSTTMGNFDGAELVDVNDDDRKYAMYERIVKAMHDPHTGVKLGPRKTFMKTVHSCFSTHSLIDWLEQNVKFPERNMAKILAQKLFDTGYIFPLEYGPIVDSEEQIIRFQTPFYWPSISNSVSDFDYAVYLSKLALKKVAMQDYETQALSQLSNALKWRWEFVQQQAAETMRSYKEMTSMNRQIMDSQESAYFWVHRPPPSKDGMAQTMIEDEEILDDRALEAPQWAEGLSQLLASEQGRIMYGDFLASEYSRENLDFWVECEKFKNLGERDQELMCKEARVIYNQFLVANAPREVNVPQGMRQVMWRKIENLQLTCTDLETSKNNIYELMNKDSYSRFLRSPEFIALVQAAEATRLIMA